MSISASLQQTIASVDVGLSDLLDLHKKNVNLNLNCHHIGTIQSFDPSNQTASISLNYPKTFYQLNPATNTYDPYPVIYPTLTKCPVICLGGGSASLTFPIKKGDECLVLFNDRDMDNWFSGATGSQTGTSRLHHLADGIAIVGLRSLPNVLSNYDTTRAVLQNGSAAVGVNSSNSKVLITNNYPTNSTTLNSVLQNLVSDLKTFATACTSSGDTTLSTAATSLSSSLSSVATAIGGLLE